MSDIPAGVDKATWRATVGTWLSEDNKKGNCLSLGQDLQELSADFQSMTIIQLQIM